VTLALKPYPLLGHLPFWAGDPLRLLESHAAHGELFELRLGVRAFVGYSPAWNKFLLSDLTTFTSAGSFSRWVPYLAGGVILHDAPGHKTRRGDLNPGFHAHALTHLKKVIRRDLEAQLPRGAFDARAWGSAASLTALNTSFFEGEFNSALLEAFLKPLHDPFPAPLLPRPGLFGQVNRELERLLKTREAKPRHDLMSYLLRFENPVEEARVSLAAGYDTTAHTLSWAAWHVAKEPSWIHNLDFAIKETLRLYPPGFIGSRRASSETAFEGQRIPKGSLVMYSPYLTQRSSSHFVDPLRWNPARFESTPSAWSYLPFGGGERICLGMHLANLVLETALETLFSAPVRGLHGDPAPKPGLTLAPRGPLRLLIE
jgi:cytochrome P450